MSTPPPRTLSPLASAGATASRPLPPDWNSVTAVKRAANVGLSPIGGEAIWKRLDEDGFDEESVKRRNKAALIAYITRLETEIYEYQHHMGILIMEKKEWTSNYEQLKASFEYTEMAYKREQAAHMLALAEANTREQNLQKALGIEKECVVNIEKALNDMRAELAEGKLTSESKLVEARKLMESAHEKFDEDAKKLLVAESLHAEASRTKNAAIRTLEDVEAREDELKRRLLSLKSEYDAKEKEITNERRALNDKQEILHQEQEKLQEERALLNQREDCTFERLRELSRLEEELEESKANIEKESKALKEERYNLNLEMDAFKTREEAILQRESLLDKRERELLILQEKIGCKEREEAQRIMDEHLSIIERERAIFEAEIEQRRKLLKNELAIKRRECEVRQSDIANKENAIHERECALESQFSLLSQEKENLTNKFNLFEEKERNLATTLRQAEIDIQSSYKERDDILMMKQELDKAKAALEDEKNEILQAEERMQLTLSERNELLVLEMKLKEEIDSFRALKKALMTEADNLKTEKEKFEFEWEVIERKREELKKEAERVDEERKALAQYLKEECNCIKLEKDNLLNKYKSDSESLYHEREEFVREMDRHHADWFKKIQQERESFLRDINIQRNELENSIKKRHEEVDVYLKEQEESLKKIKFKELQEINSQKEMIARDFEHVAREMEKLRNERKEIAHDQKQREKEWAEIRNSIEALNIQCQKLQKQRDLLHADREEIYKKIELLKELENLNIECEHKALCEMHTNKPSPIKRTLNKSAEKCFDNIDGQVNADGDLRQKLLIQNGLTKSPPASATKSWVRKCTEVIFRQSPEEDMKDDDHAKNVERLISGKSGELGSLCSDSKVKNCLGIVNGSKDPSSASKEMKKAGGTQSHAPNFDLEGVNTVSGEPPLIEMAYTLNNNASPSTRASIIKTPEDDAKKYGFLVSSVNSWLLGRKRGHNVLSHDLSNEHLEPVNKMQKRLVQDGTSGAEEINCMLKGESSHLDHEPEVPLGCQTLGVEESHARYDDHVNHDNRRLHGSSSHPISRNGLPSVHALQFYKEDQDHDKVLQSSGKLEDDESYGVSSDESYSEDEDKMSAKKLWKFLIT